MSMVKNFGSERWPALEIDNNDFHLVNDHTDDLAAGPINILGLTELTDDEIRTLSMRELNQRLKESRCTEE